MTAIGSIPSAWRRRLALFAFVVAAILVGYHETFFDMVRIWSTSSTFNHGFLIVPIAIYLATQRRAVLDGLAPSVSKAGLFFVLGNGLLWLAGALMSVAFFEHVAAVGMLVGASWGLLGPQVFRALLFPFMYLYFAVPEGEFLVPYLQDWTAIVLVKMLRLTGIPVFIEGRYLSIPSGNFVVAEACSGINYLVATLAVGAMFMYLNFRSWWRRALFMLCAVAVPLVANGLRAYGIVMIAHLSNYRYALGVDHFIYGWVFFGIVIFVLFAIGARFSDEPRVEIATNPTPRAAASSQPNAVPMMLLVLACAFLPRGLLAVSDSSRQSAPPIELPAMPGWIGPGPVDQSLGAEFLGAGQLLAGSYADDENHIVILEIAYFPDESAGSELVSQTNKLFNPASWKQLGFAYRDAPDGSIVHDLQELTLRSVDGEEYLVWQWYDVRDYRSTQRLPLKFRQAISRLLGGSGGGASVSLRTRIGDDGSGAKVLDAFSRRAEISLERLIANAGSIGR